VHANPQANVGSGLASASEPVSIVNKLAVTKLGWKVETQGKAFSNLSFIRMKTRKDLPCTLMEDFVSDCV
jgi:hypothetical protein